ncbi:MAG: O-methyltransferase [Lachnospirales bacterium]
MKSYIVKEEIVEYINDLQPFCEGELGELQKYAYEVDLPIIDKETASFISFLVELKKPKNILEIGCAVGFSAMMMARKLPDNGLLTTIDRYPQMIEKAKENFEKFGFSNKIKLIEGDAIDVLETLVKEEKKYDLVFLDAGKGQYINMLPNIIELLNCGGLLIADDLFQNGNIVKDINTIEKRQRTIHRRMNEFLKSVTECEELKSSIVPIADGVLVAVKS